MSHSVLREFKSALIAPLVGVPADKCPVNAYPDVPHMEFESVLRSSRHSELLLYRAVRNYRSIEQGRTYVARVWDRKGLADVERDRLVELLGTMVEHQRSMLVVQLHEVLVDANGRLVVVQEHVPGGSFRRVYRFHWFSLEEVLALGAQLAGALTVLHRYMPHRRVDPSTVLFRHVYDFGQQRAVTGPVLAGVEVAEVADSAGWGPWRSRWASHGVRSGDGAGGRSDDLYSVAALMCSALTRDKPPSYAGKLADPLRPDAPKSLQQLIRRTMDTDPRRRPSSAEVMLHALWEIEDECRLHRTRINGV